MRHVLSVSIALVAVALCCDAALAGPTCTRESRSNWLPEEAMKAKIAEMGYKNIRIFKVTSGNCYEIYGFTKDDRKAEVYFHPVSGAIVDSKIGD